MNWSSYFRAMCSGPNSSRIMSSRRSIYFTRRSDSAFFVEGHLSRLPTALGDVLRYRCICILLQLLVIQCGKGPHYFSIIARCSKFSCVSKNNSPVYSSTKMQAMLQISDFSVHLQHSKITSGARYYLVFMIGVWRSFSYVAPPKSITFISQEWGRYQKLLFFTVFYYFVGDSIYLA